MRVAGPASTLAAAAALLAAGASAQSAATVQPAAPRITVTWRSAPIRDVLLAFSAYSGKSIVAAPTVSGTVTATIHDRPWDVALAAILSTRGLLAVEDEHGVIRVEDARELTGREAVEPILTRSYRLSFVKAEEVRASLAPLLSSRGSISVSPGTNTIIVSDIARVHRAIAGTARRP